MLSRRTVWTMSVGCAVSVANIYYNQPLLQQMGAYFHASPKEIGSLPGFSQAGVALGMFSFVPLGDMLPRRRLIVLVSCAVAFSCVLTAIAPSLSMLYFAGFLTGLTNIVPHLVLPLAAKLAPDEQRGEVLGKVLGGLLFGILLARVVSGYVGTSLGWQAMYWVAALVMLLAALVFRLALPNDPPEGHLRYGELLRSILHLARTQPVLREAAIEGGLLFGGFSAFWSTLVFLVATPPYHYGARVAGLFGLVGAVGAAIAPRAGKLADKRGSRTTVGVAIAVALASYLVFAGFGFHLWGLVLGVILLDLGVQAGHVANQARIYGLVPSARSRLNTVYMVTYFLGGALGSWLGAYGWSSGGWLGVCLAGGLQVALAGTVWWWMARRRTARTAVENEAPLASVTTAD